MDWVNILTTLITTIIVGGGATITFLLFFKQRQKKENSDVVDRDASAALNMLDFTDKYQTFTKDIITDYNLVIKEKDAQLLKCREAASENQHQLTELRATVEEHSKKIKTISSTLTGEQRRRIYAEENICLITECKLRRPDKGTFIYNNEEVSNDNI